MIDSFFLGLFFSGMLFLLCVFLVVGVKTIIIAVKHRFVTPPVEPVAPVKKPRKKSTRKKSVVPFRSIEINPEEIDRIYVKKSS